MDLKENFFEIFRLQPLFHIDKQLLKRRYREIQKNIHPDRFADSDAQQKRLSQQYTSLVNEAYEVLDDDFSRALYLLQLVGVDTTKEVTTANTDFLMEQMQLRERLAAVKEQAEPENELAELGSVLKVKINEKARAFLQAFEKSEYDQARKVTLEWQFLVKLQEDLRRVEDELF
ncbi:MAG: Fe-S protein assembly co-chaperone HscB [Pseudomonadales bacterium]|nr:Fe-S protein assembly co-chaperone HscB [Pseudomonadales bacterium]